MMLPNTNKKFLTSSLAIVSTALLATTLALTSLGCSQPARVVSTEEDRLTVVGPATTSDERQTKESYRVAPNADISRDGEPAKLEELDKGDNVQVIATQRDGERVAIEIVAESPDPNPKRE